MTWDTYHDFRDALINEAHEEADDKAVTYASPEDRLHNFKRDAERWGTTPEQNLGQLLGKHIGSIESYVRDGRENREGVRQNVKDAIEYLCMLAALHAEKQAPTTEGQRD